VTVGKKLPQGIVEVVDRKTKQVTDVPVSGVAAFVQEKYNATIVK
jgi:hypothetical protein